MNFGIIAAGEGSRLQQEGVELPKPLVRIDSRPMIRRLIDIFIGCGAESVAIIVNEQMTEVADYLRSIEKEVSPVRLELVVRSTPSSMHSFFHLSSLLKGRGRFVLTTVDTIFRPEEFAKYVEAFDKAPAAVDAMMAVTPFVDDEKPLYVATSPDLDIEAFLDAPDASARFVSGGIYGLSDSCVDVLEQCMERGVSRMRNYQRALLEAGLDVKAYPIPKIIDVDHAADIETARRFLA